jgi:hypothetical protein
MTATPYIRHAGTAYPVRTDMQLVLQIEDALGALPQLSENFSNNRWHVETLVTLVQILLQQAGQDADFLTLGTEMIHHGLPFYHAQALHILTLITGQTA